MIMEANEVMSMDILTAYKAYTVLKLDEPELTKDYNKVRFGIKLRFDINNILTENYYIKGKAGTIWVEGNKYPLKDFYTEMEEREALIKKAILDSLEEPKLQKGWGDDTLM